MGNNVRVGQTICILEAMKLMNEIESEFNAEIVEILVENGTPVVDKYPTHSRGKLFSLFLRHLNTGSVPFLSGGMQLRICVTPSKIFSLGTILFSLLKTKLFGSLFSDLELVKAVHPSSLMVFAKKLPLKPHPKIKNFFLIFSELADLFM